MVLVPMMYCNVTDNTIANHDNCFNSIGFEICAYVIAKVST